MFTTALLIAFIFSTLLFFITTIIASYYVYKFAKIIMIFEDDLSYTIEELTKCDDQLSKILSLKLFFDSVAVKEEFQKVLEQIKYCRFSVMRMAERFIERSKQKYIVYEGPDEGEQSPISQIDVDDEGNLISSNVRMPTVPQEQELIFMTRDGRSLSNKR
jgi:hypothetical protein